MLTIPQVRKRIAEIATLVQRAGVGYEDGKLSMLGTELLTLTEAMYRRPAVQRVVKKGRPPEGALAPRIRAFHKEHPELDYEQIGKHFDVTVSSVSRSIIGKREDA